MSGKRILDIELLRGLAVLGVVFHHLHGNLFSGSPALLDGINQRVQFWWGVDLFFAISGFVIARTLIPQLREAPTRQAFWEQARYFWIRRAFRLLPSAWLWLALILACCLLLNRSGAFGSLSANLAASLAGFLQVANFRFADSFYRYEYGASFVYWSLSLEEQFYLLLPLLILCLRRYLGWA
ncbi:acyltransferase family protein, partial [Pseudomonas aeruginosa]